MAAPHLVSPPAELWRVARTSHELTFSEIDAVTAELPTAGNRFDVPGGGVLYCASDLRGCYAEVLARHRPDPKIAAIARLDAGFMEPGSVAQAWRDGRRRARIALQSAAPFVDVEDERTRAWLQAELPDVLAERAVRELDVAAIRGSDRILTRAVAHHLYVAREPGTGGELAYSGLRYVSRQGEYECWAVFRGTEIVPLSVETIEADDPALNHVTGLWGLVVHGR